MSIHFDNAERADKEIIIQADKGRRIQVISNILYNAIRFAKEGNITISIKINDVIISRGVSNGNSNSQGEVIVSIKDTGIGYIQTYSQDYSQSLLSHPKQWALD